MSITMTLTGIDAVMAALKDGCSKAQFAAKRGFMQGMTLSEGQISKTQMTGRPGVKRQSGLLAKSGRVFYENIIGGDIRGRIVWGQPGAPYGVFHDIGGKFTSKGKLFTIPINPAAKGKRPADFKEQLNFVPFKNGKEGGMLVRKPIGKQTKSSRKTSEIYYICLRTITIPRRLSISGKNSQAVQLMRITVPQAMARELAKLT